MSALFGFICEKCIHSLSVFSPLDYLTTICVCVLTGAGHGGRVGVGTVESRVAVAGSRPVSERVAVWWTLSASCIRRLGLIETSRAGCRE